MLAQIPVDNLGPDVERDPASELCQGPYGSPRGAAVSSARGNPVLLAGLAQYAMSNSGADPAVCELALQDLRQVMSHPQERVNSLLTTYWSESTSSSS